MSQLKIDLVLNKLQAMTGLRSFESNVMSIGKRLAGFVGIGGGIAGITATIQGLLDKASRLQDVSDAFNVSAESIQRLGNVGVTANLSLEEIAAKLGKLGKAAQEAANDTGGELAQAFLKIGVSVDELNKLSPEQLFDRLREAVSSGKLAGEEFSVVGKLLAKDFQRLMPILRMTAEEFNTLGQAGGIMSDAVVSSLDAANVQIKLFQENVSKRMATAAADMLSLFGILKETPSLALELFTAGDIGPIEKIAEKYSKMQEKLKERIAVERKNRQGDMDSDEAVSKERVKQLQELGTDEAKFELKLIEARIDGRRRAEQIMQSFEERTAEENVRNAERRARQVEAIGSQLEDVIAQREGPQAEFELQRQRATAAAEAARQEATPENILAAQQEALRLQQMQESRLDRMGFGEQSASRARGFVDQTVGSIPGMEALRDIQRATDMKAQETQKVQLDDVPGLPAVMGKLDELIRTAGRFN